MKTQDRRQAIIELTQALKWASIEDLASHFQVSSQTIRRDINSLCDDNILRRRHGGAELMDASTNIAYDTRAILNRGAKIAIARFIQEIIPNGATISISIGTTPTLVAESLKTHQNLTIITNNLNAAMALSHATENRIILPGGEIRLPDRDFLGEQASDIFTKYRADFGIYGVGGIDSDGMLLDFHQSEVIAREAIRQHCRCSILVADHTKFGRTAPAIGGYCHQADRIIVTGPLPKSHHHLISQLDTKLSFAPILKEHK